MSESPPARLNSDVPDGAFRSLAEASIVAVDIETSGLDYSADRIGLVQLYSPGTGVVLIRPGERRPARLIRLLENPSVQKVFHHGMFDLRFLQHHCGARARNLWDTKVASKVLNPERESHSLKYLAADYLGVHMDKSVAVTDWMAQELSSQQVEYASRDVAHLLELRAILAARLEEQGLYGAAQACFDFMPTRVELELAGSGDVFSY